MNHLKTFEKLWQADVEFMMLLYNSSVPALPYNLVLCLIQSCFWRSGEEMMISDAKTKTFTSCGE